MQSTPTTGISARSKNSALPAPQVYRLDSAKGQWKVEYELPTDRTPAGNLVYQAFSTLQRMHFTRDITGKLLDQPVNLLVAEHLLARVRDRCLLTLTFGRMVPYSRPPTISFPRRRTGTRICGAPNSVTGAQMIFAGSIDAIFSGGYDKTTKNIVWNSTADFLGPNTGKTGQGDAAQFTSFAECNGKLYAAADAIYERKDGKVPAWDSVFTAPVLTQADGARGFTNHLHSKSIGTWECSPRFLAKFARDKDLSHRFTEYGRCGSVCQSDRIARFNFPDARARHARHDSHRCLQ